MIWLNDHWVGFTRFPNNETVVPALGGSTDPVPLLPSTNMIRMRYWDDQDLVHLVLLTREIQDRGGSARLTLDYMPYSRMDRRTGDFAFSLRHIAWLINSLDFRGVEVVEPHSDVTPALLDRCTPIPIVERMLEEPEVSMFLGSDYWYFLPDAGAQKRYNLGSPRTLVGTKARNFKTGRLSGFQLLAPERERYDGQNILIVDDLCSGGRTFIGFAEALRERGFEKVCLLVAHLEETAFRGELFDKVDMVFATDSMRPREAPSGSYRNLIELPLRRFL